LKEKERERERETASKNEGKRKEGKIERRNGGFGGVVLEGNMLLCFGIFFFV
jgi:hypothetical protein